MVFHFRKGLGVSFFFLYYSCNQRLPEKLKKKLEQHENNTKCKYVYLHSGVHRIRCNNTADNTISGKLKIVRLKSLNLITRRKT